MTAQLFLVALLWGGLGGFLVLNAFINLLAVGFCLHGLLMTRWQRLAKKVSIGAVKYSVNLKLLLQVGVFALLCVVFLQMGDEFVRRKFHYTYLGSQAAVTGITALLVVAAGFKSLRRRLKDLWKISHKFDFAERRQRTRMLKG